MPSMRSQIRGHKQRHVPAKEPKRLQSPVRPHRAASPMKNDLMFKSPDGRIHASVPWVPCAYCGARVGQECINTASGKPSQFTHMKRRRAWWARFEALERQANTERLLTEHSQSAKGTEPEVTPCRPCADLLSCSVREYPHLRPTFCSSGGTFIQYSSKPFTFYPSSAPPHHFGWFCCSPPHGGHSGEGGHLSHRAREERKKTGV